VGDDFRFKLTVNEGESQAHSQTEWITVYTFHHQKGSPLPYTLTIIDTPGFAGGLERDCHITAQIREFFSMPPPYGIDQLALLHRLLLHNWDQHRSTSLTPSWPSLARTLPETYS